MPIHLTTTSNSRDALGAQGRQGSPGAQLYALIDAAQAPVRRALHDDYFPMAAFGLFEALPEQDAQSAGPYLLPLNPDEADHHARIDWLLAAETAAPCVVWLWSGAGREALFAHLQLQLIASLPGGGEALLRYYDPRVLHQLLAEGVLTQAQALHFAGPVARFQWHVPQRGHFTFTSAPPAHHAQA